MCVSTVTSPSPPPLPTTTHAINTNRRILREKIRLLTYSNPFFEIHFSCVVLRGFFFLSSLLNINKSPWGRMLHFPQFFSKSFHLLYILLTWGQCVFIDFLFTAPVMWICIGCNADPDPVSASVSIRIRIRIQMWMLIQGVKTKNLP